MTNQQTNLIDCRRDNPVRARVYNALHLVDYRVTHYVQTDLRDPVLPIYWDLCRRLWEWC